MNALVGDGRWPAARMPRFQGANLELLAKLRAVAGDMNVTATRLAIAWILARGDDIVPVIGARRPRHLSEALAALALELTPEQVAAIERAVPEGAARGARCPDALVACLDSEH